MKRLVRYLMLGSALYVALFAAAAPSLVTGDGLEPLPGDTQPVRYAVSVTPDLAAARFHATAQLTFEVLKPTATVTVNALALDITNAHLVGGEVATVSRDDARQRISFHFSRQLLPGEHDIAVDYSGPINDAFSGVFRAAFTTPTGAAGHMLYTQMCCINAARRFMPLWDQPDLKAVFELELIVASSSNAVSNMPVVERESLEGGRARVRFAPTPRMSSYLLFFAVGEFDRLTRHVGATELGMVMQRGRGEKGRFTLDTTADSIAFYNDYFDSDYPLPKLDGVAMPGVGNFGAMENWGAILYLETYIDADPGASTERERQKVYEIVAHEVAHQWFGNLVTMRWWDDLWLNEGFASWMALKTTERFHPDWNIWLHAAGDREAAMRLDAGAGTHPVIRSVKTLEEAALAFDDITYEKGSQIIRMLEGWVGEDAFRTAIRAYVRDHAYGNAVTADLLRAIDAVSPFPVTDIARDYTKQEGVPRIVVLSSRCDRKRNVTTVTLKQERFGLDEPSRRPTQWHVPVTAATVGNQDVVRKIVRGARPARLDVPGCGAVKINVGETAYFRTQYDAASFAALKSEFSRLAAADQLGLLKDSRGLAEGGYISFDQYLELAAELSETSDPMLHVDAVATMRNLDTLYLGLPSQSAFRVFTRERFSAQLRNIGWTARPGERANTATLRNELIELLGRVGDEATIAEAKRRFDGAQREHELLPGAIRKAVVRTVGAAANLATVDDFIARANRSTDYSERTLYLLAIAGASDPSVAARVLQLSLTEAVPRPLLVRVLRTVAERHPDLVLDFAISHYEQISALRGVDAAAVVASLGGYGVDATFLDRFMAFARDHLGANAVESAARTSAVVRHRDELRRRALPQVDAWIRAQT